MHAQGGDTAVLDDTELFEKAKYSLDIAAEKSGYISHLDTEKIGRASVILGAGREKKDEKIDHSAGIILNRKTGDSVGKGDVLATLFTNDKTKLCEAEKAFKSAVKFSEDKPKEENLVQCVMRNS